MTVTKGGRVEMGSPSLIILLIIVVWVIVLAPLVLGNNKPIRRSGDGYEETRVLHEGGTAPVATRRRPKLTAADIHRFEDSDNYEVVEAAEEEQVLIDDLPHHAPATPVTIDAEAETEADEAETDGAVEPAVSGGSTAYSVLRARTAEPDSEEGAAEYELAETYLNPSDFGYNEEPVVIEHEDDEAPEAAAEAEDTEDTGDTGDAAAEAESAEGELADLTEDDIAFANSRRGRGGYDPGRDARTSADRYKRRRRTFAGLLAAVVVTFIIAGVAGGWTWVLPSVTVALTVWFLVVLRGVVKQEQALRARRMRQLRRARLGVDTAQRPGPREGERMRAGAVILTIDDESPDFQELSRYRRPQTDYRRDYEYDDYGRAS